MKTSFQLFSNAAIAVVFGSLTAAFVLACGTDNPSAGDERGDANAGNELASKDAGAGDTSMGDATHADASHDAALDSSVDSSVAQDAVVPNDVVDAGPTEHTCTPWAAGPGTYDPDCIYLLGTLSEGASYRDVITYPKDPSRRDVGFPDYDDGPKIRPTDGKLTYVAFDHLLTFTADIVDAGYPQNPAANDIPITVPACTLGVGNFLYFPDDGKLAYWCLNGNGPAMYLEGTTTALGMKPSETIALGAGRSALVLRSGAFFVFANGVEVPVPSSPQVSSALAGRFVDGAFLVAFRRDADPATYELARIALDGQPTLLGTYDLGTPANAPWSRWVLDPQGHAYAFTRQGLYDGITEFSVNAAPVQIYTEENQPVKIHISSLFTGP